MQFKGVIKKILPMQTGTGKTGQSWQKVDFIMEEVTSGQYPESVAITAFGERVGELTGYSEGSVCLAVFDAHARCYTGRDGVERWVQNNNLYRLSDIAQQQPSQQPQPAGAPNVPQAPAQPQQTQQQYNDELPF